MSQLTMDVNVMMSEGEIVRKYKDMVYKIAWRMAKQHGEDFDELVSEGFWGIIRYLPIFNSEKSTLNTWVYKCAWDQMKTFCIDDRRKRMIPTDFQISDVDEIVHDVIAPEPTWIEKLMGEVTEEAAVLIQVIIEAPEELREELRPSAPSSSARALKEYMMDVMDWDVNKIEEVWKEIELCLLEPA